jgi:drug/metabolite transporter (DMT)-like permease
MFLVGTLAAVSDAIEDYPLYGGQALRYAVAAVTMLAVARVRGLGPVRLARRTAGDGPASGKARPGPGKPVRLTMSEWGLLAALSSTGLVIFNICVVEATRAAGPSLAGIVLATLPLALAVLGPLATRAARSEKRPPSPRVMGAALLVVAGAALSTGAGSGNVPGLMWSLGALACEICFSLLALPLLPKLGAIRISAYSAALAVPSLLAIGLIADGREMLRVPTAAEALGLSYLALIVTTVAFFLWYTALPRLGPDRAGLFAGMVPVGAIVTAAILGLGPPSIPDVAGAAVVVAGILLGLGISRADASGTRPPGPGATRS